MMDSPSPAREVLDSPSELLTLVKPDAEAPFEELTAVSRQCVYSQPRLPPARSEVPVPEVPSGDGRMVFGIPIHPTRYESAFQGPDNGDTEESVEVDADVFTSDGPVVSHSISPSLTTNALISSHSVLQVERTTLHRPGRKALARTARSDFAQLSEPEARLAPITAQPTMIAPVLRADHAASERAVVDHAILRVSALSDNVNPVRLRFSEFLLWSDATIHALCVSDLGTHLEPYLPLSVAVAFGLVVCDDPVSDGEVADDSVSSVADSDDDDEVDDAEIDDDDVGAAAPVGAANDIADPASPTADNDATMSSHSDELAASHHTDASL
ncbi:hypothetical protein DD237_003609 [Peronospora effusa]|uniref:Uncharacterized protein n=1 Tax=Peronospora effusa TaxID=542832 RepID=A0A425CAV6_9STRA|nr:hypothetical protein DD237_003609 [Peronospora effusa]